MTDETVESSAYGSAAFRRHLRRRRGYERQLRWIGVLAIALAVGMLLLLFGSVLMQSVTAFKQTRIALPIHFDSALFDASGGDPTEAIEKADYRTLVNEALYGLVGRPDDRRERRQLNRMMSASAGFQLRGQLLEHPEWIGETKVVWLPASGDVDVIAKGVAPRDVPESERLVSDLQLAWIDGLIADGRLETRINWDIFQRTDSREPEVAGIYGAVIGSALMLFVTLIVALPIGVAASIYLEEFAPKNRWTELIDVNIRNLAAVPSILFGLLGLAVFIRLFGVPRSTPVAGGLVLALLALPTIVIAARAAIHAVPPSLREAALQLGASKMQTTFLVVLPNALPGILTGTIIAMAEALGETAPLLMIGMVAFIAGSPTGFGDPAAPLPVQIYLWSTSPERGFVEKTAAAIVVLLLFLVVMNALAIYLRMRAQRRW